MGLDLYNPEYEQTVRGRAQRGVSTEQLVNDMGELVVSDARRRDTFPVRTYCRSVFPYTWLNFSIPANAIRLFSAFCIDFRALRYIVHVFTPLSRFRKLGL